MIYLIIRTNVNIIVNLINAIKFDALVIPLKLILIRSIPYSILCSANTAF